MKIIRKRLTVVNRGPSKEDHKKNEKAISKCIENYFKKMEQKGWVRCEDDICTGDAMFRYEAYVTVKKDKKQNDKLRQSIREKNIAEILSLEDINLPAYYTGQLMYDDYVVMTKKDARRLGLPFLKKDYVRKDLALVNIYEIKLNKEIRT